MASTDESRGGVRRAMYWDALLAEVPLSVGRMLPTLVTLREASDDTWQVYARFRGNEIVQAEDLAYDEAVQLVMGIFARLMEEARIAGRLPLPVA